MTSSSPSAPRIPAQISKHLAQLPITHPVELNGCQGPVTMQTRVAVRDATPHRFQVIPLREAKSRNNILEPRAVGAKDLKYRVRVSRSTDWQPPPVPPFPPSSYSRSNFSPHPGSRGNDTPDKPSMLSVVEKVRVQSEKNTSGNVELQLPLTPRDASKAVCLQDKHRPGPLSLVKPSCTPSTGPSSTTKAHGKQLTQKVTWRVSTDCCTCNAVSNRTKVRACSEDLTRHQNKTARNRVYERLLPLCSGDDSSWCTTKRHAIYSDTLVLPLSSPELDLTGPQQISMTLTPRNYQAPIGHPCRQCTKPRHLEDIFGPQSNALPLRIVTSSQTEQNFAPRRFSVQTRPSTELSSCPSVPNLRLSTKVRGCSAFPARSNLNVVHGQPLKHPKIILDLLIQLDQAIEEWDRLKRVCRRTVEHSSG